MFKSRPNFSLDYKEWLSEDDAMIGLLLSSFVINVLGLVFPVCVLQFYDRVIPHKSGGTLTVMVLIILGAFLLENILKILRAYVSSWASARFTFNMGSKLFKHLMNADINEFEKDTAGAYLDRFNSAESLKEYYCGQNLVMLVDLPFIFVYLSLLYFINKYMLITPLGFMLLMIAVSIFTVETTNVKLKAKINMAEVKDKFLIEMISGIHTIKSLGMEEQFLRRYERLHQKEISNNYEFIQRVSESTNSGNLFSQLAIVCSVCVGGVLVMKQVLTVGGLAASVLLIGKIMQPVTKLISFIEKQNNIEIAKEDMNYIMKFKPEYAGGLTFVNQVLGDIRLQNVSFKYSGDKPYVLNNINLEIAVNDTVVIHGTEGSGKTTLLLLISSLLKPQEGTITVDGNDLKNIDLESYRAQIGYMPDNGELFSGTIMENLTLFENEKYANEAKQIAKEIGLHEIIEKMPQAYNTEVGGGTVDLLSRGHKQQVLIVRALLNHPNLILFDEANMSLDIDSDVKLRKFLLSKKGKATIVLVTHRPSLLEMANKHFKLEGGTITEFKWQ